MSKSIYKILTHRSRILHTKANEELIFPLSSKTEDIIYKTIDTLRYNKGVYEKRGLALAANQIGSLKRFFVMFDSSVHPVGRKVNIICNPEILETSEDQEDMYEGCLSITKYQCLVKRPKKCLVKFQDFNGRSDKMELEGFIARVFQHEIDHLNGYTMLERQSKTIENPLYTEFKKNQKLEKLGKLQSKKDLIDFSKFDKKAPEDF